MEVRLRHREVSLRKWRLEDVEFLREASFDGYVADMIGIVPGCNSAEAQRWIRKRTAARQVIVADGEAVGEVGIVNTNLHYWLLQRARRQGLAQRAVAMACQKSDQLIVTAFVSERNHDSIRVLERVGFKRGFRTNQYAGYPDVRDTLNYFWVKT